MKKPLLILILPLLLCGAHFAPLPAVFPASSKPFKIEIAPPQYLRAPLKIVMQPSAEVRQQEKKQKPVSELEMRFRAERFFSASA